MTQARNWNTPEAILARVHLMSQSVLLSDGMFLHGGSYFNCYIIIWECFPLQYLPNQHPSWLCIVSSSARQNCSLSTGSIWSWARVWNHHSHALQIAGTGARAAALLSLLVKLPCFYGWGRGPILPVFVSVLFHMSSQRNKWEIKHVQESEINLIESWRDNPDGYIYSGDGFHKKTPPSLFTQSHNNFQKNPSKTQIFHPIDLLLIELTGDL